MANFLKQTVQYRLRKTGDQSTIFYLMDMPNYLPTENQIVAVVHTDIQADSALDGFVKSQQTNVFTASFVRLQTLTTPVDGYTYAMELVYTNPVLLTTPGRCYGTIEYEVNPGTYEIMKPVSATAIVQELLPFNGTDGKNLLYCYQRDFGTTDKIAPMLVANKALVTSIFSNLFKSFNLPTTPAEVAEFRQTALGTLIRDAAGPIYVEGVRYRWEVTGTSSDTVIDPINGYTGKYYGTAYAGLCSDYGGSPYNYILVTEIPHAQYGEIIDGKTIKLTLPKSGGGSYNIYGAFQENSTLFNTSGLDTYLSENNPMSSAFGVPMLNGVSTDSDDLTTNYQSNIVLLFSDQIQKPNNDVSKSWSTGYTAVMGGEKVYIHNAATKKEMFNLITDRCVGIAYLDKGFIVITNPTIVQDIILNYKNTGVYGTAGYSGQDESAKLITTYLTNAPTVIDKSQSQFLFSSGNTFSTCEFRSFNTEKSLNVVCLASTDEFYRTTNPTAKALLGTPSTNDFADFKPDQNSNGYLYPVIITELGLHDADGNLLAICKPTTPIQKYWYDVVSFNIRIKL